MDYNASTPLADDVLEGMLPYLSGSFGNASSRHDYGRVARSAIDDARQRVADALGAHPTEVIFTSGGTEANNLFIKGVCALKKPGTVIISSVEHPCVREPARQIAASGWALRELAADVDGVIEQSEFRQVVSGIADGEHIVVSVMHANNETGVMQDVAALAVELKAIQSKRGLRSGGGEARFHTDAVQVFGKGVLNFRELNASGVHALTVSAHKIGGPKGVGALVLDKRVELQTLLAGGGHERGIRSGTENVAAIVGFGLAAEKLNGALAERSSKTLALRNELERGLLAMNAILFGAGAERLPNTCYFALPGIDGETLVGRLDREGFAVASGAACSSVNPEPSYVLMAMGVESELARGAVRVSLGTGNTQQQVRDFLSALSVTRSKLLNMSALLN